MSRLDRISAQEYDIQKRIWLQGINSRHSMRGTAGRSTREDDVSPSLSNHLEYLSQRQAVLDGQPIPPRRQTYELAQFDPFRVPTRVSPPVIFSSQESQRPRTVIRPQQAPQIEPLVTLPHEESTRPRRVRSTRIPQPSQQIEPPVSNPRGIDRGPDIIPPFVNNVDETPSIPPIVYLESIQDANRRIEEERLWDARAVQSQRTRDELNSIINFLSSFGRFVTGDENSMRQYDDIYNWGNESNHQFQGSVMGIGIGASRFVRGIVTSFAQLYDLIRNLPWETLRLSNSDDYIQTLELLQSIAEGEWEDPAMSREILNGIGEFFNNIGNRFVRAIEYAENGNNVESSAQIIEGTLEIIDLIDMVEGAFSIARHSPQTIRRLTNLRAARMKMIEIVATLRMIKQVIREEGVFGRHVDNFDDVNFSISPFGGEISRPSTRHTSSERELVLIQAQEYRRYIRNLRNVIRNRREREMSFILNAQQNLRNGIRNRGNTERLFRERMIDVITNPNLSTPHRFIDFIDPNTGRFYNITGHLDVIPGGHENHLTFQAGHMDDFSTGRRERLALQRTADNLREGRQAGRDGRAIIERTSLIIDDVVFERNTASFMVNEGLLTAREFRNAQHSIGWDPLQWYVSEGSTPGELVWREITNLVPTPTRRR